MNPDQQFMSSPAIIHIITGLDVGGAEHMLLKLTKQQKSSGKSVVVVCLRGPGAMAELYANAGINVMYLGINPQVPVTTLGVGRLIQFVWKIRPDVIQGWMYHGNLIALFAHVCFLFRAKLFWNIRQTIDGLDFEKLSTRMAIRLGAMVSWIPIGVAYNSRVAAHQHEQLGYCEKQRRVIPNGFELDRFSPLPPMERRRWRSKIGVHPDSFVIGHIARFHKKKDHRTFLASIRTLLKEREGIDIVAAGKGVCLENEELKSFLVDQKLEESVRLLGAQSNIREIMGCFDIFVSSSSMGEGFPNTIGEAMACGVPCVVTDVGESRNIVGDYGWVVQPREPRELATVLMDIFDQPRGLLKKMGTDARARINDYYNIKSIEQDYEHLYFSRVEDIQ